MSRFDFQEPNRNVFGAMPDWLGYRMGLREPRDPVAIEMCERAMTFPDLIRHVTGAGRDTPIALVADRAMGTDDFKQALVTSIGTIATGQFTMNTAWLWGLVRRIPVSNFRPVRAQSFSAEGFTALPEQAERRYSAVQVDDGLETAQVETLGTLRNISRQAIINDDLGVIGAQIDAITAAANLQLLTSVAEALEAVDNLSDGEPFFSASKGNLIASGSAPSITALDEISAAMYRMERPKGGIVAALPRFVLCPPELLGTVRTLMLATYDKPETTGTGATAVGSGVGYAVLPFTDTGAWYCLADPMIEPALAILTLQGAASPLLVESRPTPISRDGVSYRATLDYRVTRLSRYGCAKNSGQA